MLSKIRAIGICICMVGCVVCMSLWGLHSCVMRVCQGPLIGNCIDFVYEDCGILKLFGYGFIFVLLHLLQMNLLLVRACGCMLDYRC